jgi:hypothetical protein
VWAAPRPPLAKTFVRLTTTRTPALHALGRLGKVKSQRVRASGQTSRRASRFRVYLPRRARETNLGWLTSVKLAEVVISGQAAACPA